MAVVLKIDYEGQLHRILLPEDGVNYEAVWQAVRELSPSEATMAKYLDEENDLCTLCRSSFLDFVSLAGNHNGKQILKLVVSVGTASSLAANSETVAVTEHSAAVTEEAAATDDTEQADVLEHVVPTVAAEVQSSDAPPTSTEAVEIADLDVELAISQNKEPAVEASHDEEESSVVSVEDMAEIAATPDTETCAEASHEEEAEASAQGEEGTESADGIDLLISMGFSRLQAWEALQESHGSVELAVEYLLKENRSSPLEKLEHKVRALPRKVTEQLRKLQGQLRDMVAEIQQQRGSMHEQFSDSEHLQSLQASLEEMRSRLGEFRKLVGAALKKASGSVPADADEEEQLQKVDAQIADAQQFVAETLDSLQAGGAEVVKGVMAHSQTEGIAAVARETLDAAATAAADAAESAMATVDGFLSNETASSDGTERDDLAQDDSTSRPCQQQENTNATAVDQAQVFVSQSISALRATASGLLKPKRNDNWVTVRAASSSSSSSPSSSSSSVSAPSGDEREGAEAVPAAFTASTHDADDAFLLVGGRCPESGP